MGKYNVYYSQYSVFQVEASSVDDAKYKVLLNRNELIHKKRTQAVVEVLNSNNDNFFRCPTCNSKVQYLNFQKQEIYYLNKIGKRKKDYIVPQGEIEQELEGHLNCENDMCDYIMPYSCVFEEGY